MNAIILNKLNECNKNYDEKIAQMIEQKDKMNFYYQNADRIISTLEKFYKKLKFVEIANLNVSNTGKISLSMKVADTFKFYIFSGYTKTGETKNYNRMVKRSIKIANEINEILKDFNVMTDVNQYSLEHKLNEESDTILINIYYK